MYYCENILNIKEVKEVYKHLFLKHRWTVANPYGDKNFGTDLDGVYLTSVVMNKYKDTPVGIFEPYLYGLFRGILFSINQKLKNKYNFTFDIEEENIFKIQLNAQKKSDYNKYHIDDEYAYSIIGFLTPFWDKSWGGELQIESERIDFSPGDFLVFKSNKLHDALPIIKETPFYRVTAAMFINP